MSFGEAIKDLVAMGPSSAARFSGSITPELIEAALAATGSASARRRKMPADSAIWLVIGMGLFGDRSIEQVFNQLDLVIPGVDKIARSSIAQARARLGADALRWLFGTTAEAWLPKVAQSGFHGLSLFAVDGTCVRVPDSDENYEYFGKPAGSHEAAYPQLRMAALMALRERLLVDARFGPYNVAEQELAKGLWAKLPDDSLTILDRGFVDYTLFAELFASGRNRHVLVRMRSDVKLEVIEELPDGSAIARWLPSKPVRAARPDLPQQIIGRLIRYEHPDSEGPSRLFTSLIDPIKFPAEELIALYHERWEIELGFDELKTHMLERNETLRCKSPSAIEQEVWGILLAYNLVRFELARVAAAESVEPKRVSFRFGVITMRSLWELTGWRVSPGTMPKELLTVRSRCAVHILPPRRSERRFPRQTKIVRSRYPKNHGTRRNNVVGP